MRDTVWFRMLGVGVAASIAALTVALALTGRLGLYINPDSSWFAVSMAVLALVGVVGSFLLPLGAAEDHGHDHGDAPAAAPARAAAAASAAAPAGATSVAAPAAAGAAAMSRIRRSSADSDQNPAFDPNPAHISESTTVAGGGRTDARGGRTDAGGGRTDARGGGTDAGGHPHAHAPHHVHHPPHAHAPRRRGAAAATLAGGVLALGVAGTMLVVPPATLSAELAASRDTGAAPLFQGADTVALAITGDTAAFGIGDWASVFATATDPEVFDGTEISLTGFVAPGDDGFDLTRLIITHCVIDAQPASLPVAADDIPDGGQWVTVTGTIRDVDGQLRVDAASVEPIDEPEDPYEF